MKNKKWTEEEREFIRLNWQRCSDAELGERLGRSASAVANVRREMKVSPNRTWTPEEETFLADNWGTVSVNAICKKLNRSHKAVMVRVQQLGLPPYFESGEYITMHQLRILKTIMGNSAKT